ncbi:MAG TPA: imelysin family protein [Cyclobacteriaceae bacterium]
MKGLILLTIASTAFFLTNCSDNNGNVPAIDKTINAAILADFPAQVAVPVYTGLATKSALLYSDVQNFNTSLSQTDLAKAQADWKAAREIWEQSESHLFGPVTTELVDPRIDTWPVNFTDLDQQLASGNAFTETYINSLDDALKGFHPIEYLLFGKNGQKKSTDFTQRELQYLVALAKNLRDLSAGCAAKWTVDGNFGAEVATAGNGSAVYSTQLAAFEEIVKAMADICDEVGNGKIKEPYDAKNPALEESPFSGNSITDFTNNIRGVRNVYTGKFTTDGHGLDELVKIHNLSLDAEVSQKIDAAINALGQITGPFGAAITTQTVQIENAMAAINDLHSTLDNKLLPFVQQHSN